MLKMYVIMMTDYHVYFCCHQLRLASFMCLVQKTCLAVAYANMFSSGSSNFKNAFLPRHQNTWYLLQVYHTCLNHDKNACCSLFSYLCLLMLSWKYLVSIVTFVLITEKQQGDKTIFKHMEHMNLQYDTQIQSTAKAGRIALLSFTEQKSRCRDLSVVSDKV